MCLFFFFYAFQFVVFLYRLRTHNAARFHVAVIVGQVEPKKKRKRKSLDLCMCVHKWRYAATNTTIRQRRGLRMHIRPTKPDLMSHSILSHVKKRDQLPILYEMIILPLLPLPAINDLSPFPPQQYRSVHELHIPCQTIKSFRQIHVI